MVYVCCLADHLVQQLYPTVTSQNQCMLPAAGERVFKRVWAADCWYRHELSLLIRTHRDGTGRAQWSRLLRRRANPLCTGHRYHKQVVHGSLVRQGWPGLASSVRALPVCTLNTARPTSSRQLPTGPPRSCGHMSWCVTPKHQGTISVQQSAGRPPIGCPRTTRATQAINTGGRGPTWLSNGKQV